MLQRIALTSIKFILSFSLFCPVMAFAHLVSITATTPFPATVTLSSLTTASFTVTNTTSKTPLNIINQSQFPQGSGLSVLPISTCGKQLTQPKQSCNITLQLQAPAKPQAITAELQVWAHPSRDGVRFPFNVTVTGSQPQPTFLTQAYIANNTVDKSISICPALQNSNSFDSCTFFSNSTFNFPVDIILNKTSSIAYIANSGNNSISTCQVSLTDGSLSNCEATTGLGTKFAGLTLNAANTELYYTDYMSNRVGYCSVSSQGNLQNCQHETHVFFRPNGRVALNSLGTFAYTPESSSQSVTMCNVNIDGTFGTCGNPNTDIAFTGPLGAVIDPMDANLYVSNYDGTSSSVAICPIDPVNGTLGICNSSAGNNLFNFSDDNATNMFIRSINGTLYLYAPNGGTSAPGSIAICPIQGNTLGTCTTFSDQKIKTPDGIWIATINQNP